MRKLQLRLNVFIIILSAGAALMIFLTVWFFKKNTESFLAANPYIVEKEREERAEKEGTESDTEGSEPASPENGNPISGVISDLFD